MSNHRVVRSRGVRALLAGVSGLALASGLLAGATVASPPVSADTTGYNNFVTLNPSGGNTAADGLRIVVSSGAYGIWRNGQQQVYGAGSATALASRDYPFNSIMLVLDDDTLVSYAAGDTGGPDVRAAWGASEETMQRMSWIAAETTITQSGTDSQPWIAETVLVADVDADGSGDDSLVVTTSYQVPDDTIGLTYRLHRTTSANYRLYHGVDMYLDGDDFGPGTTSIVDGRRIVAQYNDTGVGGFRQSNAAVDDTTWASFMEGYYRCPFGYPDSDCANSPYGPYDATRYPNSVNPDRVDAGVGIEFDMGTGSGVETAASEFYFAKRPGVIQGRFTERSVAADDTATFVITLSTPAGVSSSNVGFTLGIPGGFRTPRVYAGTPSTTCESGTVTLGTGTVTDDSVVVSGVTLSGGQSCTVSIPISGFDGVPGIDYRIGPSDVSGVTGTPTPLLDINDQIVVEGDRYNSEPKTINNAGGTPGTGLKITYGAGQVQIVRNTAAQLYSPDYVPQSYIEPDLFNGYFLLVDDTLVGTKSGWPDDESGWVPLAPGVTSIVNWDDVTVEGGSSRGSGTITSVLTYDAPGGNTYTLTVELIYDIASSTATTDAVRERLTLSVPPGHNQDDTIKLYRGMDTYLNGVDFGQGFADDSTTGAPRQVGAISADNAVKQWLEAVDDTLWDGWYANTFACPVNPEYNDPLYGSCVSLDDSLVNAIVAGGNLWDDTTSAAIATDPSTDMGLAVMWDVDDTTGSYTYTYDIRFADLPGTPSWVTTALPDMQVGTPLSTTVVANPGAGVDDSTMLYEVVQGELPAGLELNRADGQITGTPTTPGDYSVIMEATDVVGASAYRTFSGTVTAQPSPAVPPSAPLTVIAVAGDGQATITWDPPASSGSFPITEYRVTASAGGGTCLVDAPETTCTIDSLTNGTAYTFTVEALNGAGWGAPGRSNEVTPSAPSEPSIRIEGTYLTGRVEVVGVTLDLAPGTLLTPMVRLAGQSTFTAGTGIRTLREDGSFTWTRRVIGGKAVEVYFTGGGAQSNRLRLTAPTTRSITLVGTRQSDGRHDRIRAGGQTVGFDAGTRLTPFIQYSGQSGFTKGKATIRVGADGSYTWTRQISRNRAVTAYVGFEDVRSNRVTWDVLGR